jgi:hypothetical protein
MTEYKGYFIVGTAVMVHPRSPDWHAMGIIWSKTPDGLFVEVERTGGPVFTTKAAAEKHGLELCQEWVEETLSARGNVSASAIERKPI